VTGDLPSAQATALENGASVLVVTDGAAVTEHILALAREHVAMVISTNYRTFTAVRALSMSVSAQDIMKRQFHFSHPEDYLDDIRPELLQNNALPVVDSKRRLVGYLSRTDIINARPKQVYLVDHNERSQAIDGIEEAELLGIIDHHRVADISTTRPILFRVEPVGSTSTIIATLYNEENIPLPSEVAGILLGGVLSDTLVLRSPTCTPRDKRIATELASLAGEDVEQFGQEIFTVATSKLGTQPAEPLLTADFKEFVIEASRFAIGTVEAVNTATLEKRIPELLSTMELIAQEHRYASFLFMIVNILQARCHLLIWGGEHAVAEVLGVPLETNGHTAVVDGLVSRKKQLVPLLPRIHEAMEALPHRRG
jgi:manganese-dependent inorganic pyrophosphatase